VRAPLTGIVLAVEMTGRGDLMLPLLSASLMAMLTTMLLDRESIYETLKRRMIARQARVPTCCCPWCVRPHIPRHGFSFAIIDFFAKRPAAAQ
jgi:hypothetical protein